MPPTCREVSRATWCRKKLARTREPPLSPLDPAGWEAWTTRRFACGWYRMPSLFVCRNLHFWPRLQLPSAKKRQGTVQSASDVMESREGEEGFQDREEGISSAVLRCHHEERP